MRIAVVDPSRVVLKIVSATLEEAGHDVVGFTDAAQALRRLRATPFVDVLITSLQLGGMDGIELTQKARETAGQRRALYVIVMSSSGDRSTLVQALDSGADDFIGKPPAEEELLARLRVAERVSTLQSTLIRLATIDALTGLLNRRAFFEIASVCDRSPTDAVAIFDIDRFKQINDQYGHAAGDRVIADVSGTAAARLPVVGRIGGEEFAVLLAGATLEAATALCEELRTDVERLDFAEIGPALKPTCSFGVAAWRPEETIDDALIRADAALYFAKSSGRNRVAVAADAPKVDGAAHTATLLSPERS